MTLAGQGRAVLGQAGGVKDAGQRETVGVREPWVEGRVRGSPEPPMPLVAERVWPELEFKEGLEMVSAGDWILMLERRGKVWAFPRQEAAAEARLAGDLKELEPALDNLYGMALHPRWRENGEVFVSYTAGADLEDGTKLMRLRLRSMQPPELDLNGAELVLTWRSGGHNGACLRFGPDGFLYVSTGDATAPNPPDALNTGQDNSDLLAAILRVDVDRRDAGLNYAVPEDNPFAGREGVRPEIWAFGFRNPWKMSFDKRGRLWCGDVGWELWEMIHLVRQGGNHGWSAQEASQAIKPETLSPLAPVTPPLMAHPHSEAASITGGFVYEGRRLPELRGAYVYGDYETGKIWALWCDEENRVTRHEEIADTPLRIVSFGLLEDGEIVFADYGTPTTLHRLARNPAAGRSGVFPLKLSETGIFADTAGQRPAAGVFPYTVAEPPWEDGLRARRFIALPGRERVVTEITRRKDGSIQRVRQQWPQDAVLVKSLSAPGASERLVETQLLHFDGQGWNGYSYRWNDEQTDALLVEAPGLEVTLADGRQHRFAARAECARCHTSWAGYTIGFQAAQLREIAGASAVESGLALGLVDEGFFEVQKERLAGSTDENAPLEERVRSWLHGNCAHCHRLHGGGSVPLMVNIEQALEETRMIGQMPERGDFGLAEARVVLPGAPWRSVLVARVATTGAGHMPQIGSREVDVRGLGLLWEWICQMPPGGAVERDGLSAEARERDRTESEKLHALAGAGSEVVKRGLLELAATPHGALRVARALDEGLAVGREAEVAGAILDGPSDALTSGVLERFLPAEKRRAVIGLSPDRKLLLATPGDAVAGAGLLSPHGRLASCLACHLLNGTGRDFGPDLSRVGGRLDRVRLLDSLLSPSAEVAPEFRAYSAVLDDGSVHTGLLLEENDEEVRLKLPSGQSLALPRARIEQWRMLPGSLMPEGLLQTLTPQEAADVLAFMESLR